MIHEIGIELQRELRAAGCPLAVIDGPEAAKTTTWGRERIVIEYDTAGTDEIIPPRGLSINPKRRHLVNEACKVTIYVQSVGVGAIMAEHRRRAKHVRDAVVCALDIVAAKRKNRWAPGAGRFVTPEDLATAERPGGAVYELAFTFERAIPSITWAGEKEPEGTITGVGSMTQVHAPGAPANDPGVTACGD